MLPRLKLRFAALLKNTAALLRAERPEGVRRVGSGTILLLAVLLLCGCADAGKNLSGAPGSADEALIFSGAAATESKHLSGTPDGSVSGAVNMSGARAFSLLYTTDAHGHIASGPDCIGLDKIAAAHAALPHSLLLDAGDFLHGTALASVNKGLEVVKLMKASGYFAAAVGNHEFSHGFPALLAAWAETGPAMHLLAANVLLPDGSFLFADSAATQVNGVKVCVFGLSTPRTPVLASPSAVRGLTFTDPVRTARLETERLRASGCEFVLALAHLGSDSPEGIRSTDVAAALGENGREAALDLIIDGHSHVELEENVNGVLVVSSGAHGKKLGRLDVLYDPVAGRVLSLRNRLLSPTDLGNLDEQVAQGKQVEQGDLKNLRNLVPDAVVGRGLAALEASLDADAWLGEVVAKSAVALNGEKAAVRTRETNLGNLCADAMRAVYDTDFALLNGGSLRRSLPAGPLTRGDILELAPFGGSVVSLRVSGRELKEILEHGYSFLPDPNGAFAQVSGLTLRLAPENAPGSRVLEIREAASDRKLEPERQYTLVVSDFMAEGGDGYPILADKPRLGQSVLFTDAVIDFLREQGSAPYREGLPARILKR